MSFFNKKSSQVNTEVQLMDRIEQLIQENPSQKYCGFFKDKEKNSVALLLDQNESQINITLIDTHDRISQIQSVIKENDAEIKLLSVSSVNKGYGGLLMREFLYQCKVHSITNIHGVLSFVRLKSEDKNRILHFFKKHGFEIQLDDKNKKVVIHYISE